MFTHLDTFETATTRRYDIRQVTHKNGSRQYKVKMNRLRDSKTGEFIELSVPSVTTVLSVRNKEWLQQWREAVGTAEADRVSHVASSNGSTMHQLCENYLNNLDYDSGVSRLMPEPKFLFKTVKPELDKIDNILALEKRLIGLQLGVGGTVDCVADYDGVTSIIDFKTSRRVKYKEDIETYFAQCAAYALMIYEMYGIVINNIAIIMSVQEPQQSIVFQDKVSNWVGYMKETIEMYNTEVLCH